MKKSANVLAAILILVGIYSLLKDKVPGPSPGPVKGLRVIFVYEAGEKLTKDQIIARDSAKVRDWLDAKCEGGKAGWRSWDKDVDVSAESKLWQDVWEASKPVLGQLPQVVIVSGQKGKAYPFPVTEQAMLEFLAKFGGK